MEYSLHHFLFTGISIAISVLITAVASLAVITQFYPGLLIAGIQRLWRTWHGMELKSLKVKGDFKFSYLERGSPKRKTLLFLHGITSSKDSWLDVIKFLPSTNLHVIALDLPCHGDSSATEDCTIHKMVDLVHEFCHATGLSKKRFHLAGLSLGGFVTGLYAAKYPDELISAILMCPAGLKSEETIKLGLEHEKALGGKHVFFPETIEEMRTLMSYAVHKKQADRYPEFLMKLILEERKGRMEDVRKVFSLIKEEKYKYALMPKMKSITMPTLVIWGRNDRLLHVAGADILKNNIPNCRVEIIENSGHVFTIEDAELTTNLVLNFINEVS